MNPYRKWFKFVVWFGILGNWTFAAWVLFVNPIQVLSGLELGSVNNTIWLFNYSVLLAILSCFYIPAASDPLRYRVNAWLLIAGRLIPATTFFVGVYLGFMPRGFLKLGLGDGSIGLIELFLLRRLLAAAATNAASVPLAPVGASAIRTGDQPA
jgi:hypothetical protein